MGINKMYQFWLKEFEICRNVGVYTICDLATKGCHAISIVSVRSFRREWRVHTMTIRVCAASIGLWSRSMGVGKHAGRAQESPRNSSFLNGRFFSREFHIEMQPAAGALSGNRQASAFLWKFNKKSLFKKWVRSRKFYNFNAMSILILIKFVGSESAVSAV